MKKLFTITSTLLVLGMMLLNGCLQDKCTQTMTFYTYEPVYKSLEEVRAGVKSEAARSIQRPGKIYFKDAYVFIVEVNEGVHVLNNTDPSQPSSEAFIAVPGARDLAIRGNSMYVDSYLDLVAIDITNVQAAVETHRETDVFHYGTWHPGLWADQNLGIAVDWIETEHVEEAECGDNNFLGGWGGNAFFRAEALDLAGAASNSNLNAPSAGGGSDVSSGVGGSMARFTISGSYLYTVPQGQLLVFDVASPATPNKVSEQWINWDVETIFPKGDKLFIGSQTGMHIYSIAQPTSPEHVSSIQHVRSCDPVVVEGNYAYVTIRDGNNCGGESVNQLFVVDLTNIQSPQTIATYEMHNPHGLGIRNGILFLCDGDEGLKVFDASDVYKIDDNQLAHFKNIHAFDVIPLHNLLLMIGEDGLYQYDYSDLDNIYQLSHIPVIR
ncbi:MAG: hypothetical protein AAFR61_09925 [Bacteroidota bacterium]